jgi:hypothetical protein
LAHLASDNATQIALIFHIGTSFKCTTLCNKTSSMHYSLIFDWRVCVMLQECAQKRIGLLITLVNLESVSILCVCVCVCISLSLFVFLRFQQLPLLVIVFVPDEMVGPSAAPSCGLAGGLPPGNR